MIIIELIKPTSTNEAKQVAIHLFDIRRNGQTYCAIAIEGSPIQEFDFEEACDIWSGWRNHWINVVV